MFTSNIGSTSELQPKTQAALRFHENHILIHATSFRIFPMGIGQSGQPSPETDTGTRDGRILSQVYPRSDPELPRQHAAPTFFSTSEDHANRSYYPHLLGEIQAGRAEGKGFTFSMFPGGT